jgi:hypothetical protein
VVTQQCATTTASVKPFPLQLFLLSMDTGSRCPDFASGPHEGSAWPTNSPKWRKNHVSST